MESEIEAAAAWPGPRNEDEWMDGNASVTPIVEANAARRDPEVVPVDPEPDPEPEAEPDGGTPEPEPDPA
jgi:hypothetical protein